MANRKSSRSGSDAQPRGILLGERDRLILDTLTRRVRALSIGQVARTFWEGTNSAQRSAARRVGELEVAGLLEQHVVLAHPELELDAPILVWRPGNPTPEFGKIAYCLKSRWRHPPQATRIVIATAEAGTWLGGYGGRIPRASETTHDLHLASVYLRMLKAQPRRARKWESEARLLARGGGRGEKLPDALIRSRGGATAIEFGGAYPVTKLRAFHEHCRNRGLAYELW